MKTVNIKSPVVLYIQCIENKIVKEIGVYENRQNVGYTFLPHKNFKSTSYFAWCTKHFHGIIWSSGYKKYTNMTKY